MPETKRQEYKMGDKEPRQEDSMGVCSCRFKAREAESAIAVMDFENTFVSAKKLDKYIRIDHIDDWLHWHFNVVEKIVILDSRHSDGIRSRFARSGWMIFDSSDGNVDEEDEHDCARHCQTDIELSLTIYDSYLQLNPGNFILISGDGEFVPLVRRMRKDRCNVEILSFKDSLSRRLARFANKIHDIAGILDFAASQSSRLEKLISYTFETNDRRDLPNLGQRQSNGDLSVGLVAPFSSLRGCREGR